LSDWPAYTNKLKGDHPAFYRKEHADHSSGWSRNVVIGLASVFAVKTMPWERPFIVAFRNDESA
jgi:uncharacterized Fe-S cluster protein YjdI